MGLKTNTILVILLTFVNVHLSAYETLRGPTQTRHWDKENAFNGYTLFGAKGNAYLIDMAGRVVHIWEGMGTSPELLYYNGSILDATKPNEKGQDSFIEKDWHGNTIWQYTETRPNYDPHHDWVRIYNKKLGEYTTIYIANKLVDPDSAIAYGANPANGPYHGAQMDALVEVDSKGNIIWEWWFFNHIIQDIDSTKNSYAGEGKTIADYPGRININLPGRPLKRDWLHCNSIDYNPDHGHLVTNSVQGEFYVIDHDGTFIPDNPDSSIKLAAGPGGDILYRFGDPARYSQGDPPSIRTDWTKSTTGHKQIGGSHDIHWIEKGLPGAGNLLVFNNGNYLFEATSQSYIFEINPYLQKSGTAQTNYINPPDAGYTIWESPDHDTHKMKKNLSNQIVWMYYSRSNQGFFSHIGSGAQRLPNGNTLICAMTEGHIFEVTPGEDGAMGSFEGEPEVVWEYINPITEDGIKDTITDHYPCDNAIFRAYRYGPDHPAFKNKDMTPGKPITETASIRKAVKPQIRPKKIKR